jgi:branched-chain amino acid transport system substrate-binding protein
MTIWSTPLRTLAAAGILATGLAHGVAAQGVQPLKIGVLTDLSGPYADSGGPGSVLAAQMAVADFGGSLKGRKIEIVAGDTLNKPDVASSVARK